MYKLLAAALIAFAAPRAHAGGDTQLSDFYRDRARALDAVATVDDDTTVLRVDVYRVAALRSAWDRAVAAGDVKHAGQYAVGHLAALRDEKSTRKQLARDRDNLHVARMRLMADEFVMQHPPGRG